MTDFKVGDLVIVVRPTSDYFQDEIVEVVRVYDDMVKVKLIKPIPNHYEVGRIFDWYQNRVRKYSSKICYKCIHACKMKEPCPLYEGEEE